MIGLTIFLGILSIVTLVFSKPQTIETFVYAPLTDTYLGTLATFINEKSEIINPASITCDKSTFKCKLEFNNVEIPEIEDVLLTALKNFYDKYGIYYLLIEPIDWDKKLLNSTREKVLEYSLRENYNVRKAFVQSPKNSYIWIMNPEGTPDHLTVEEVSIKQFKNELGNFIIRGINYLKIKDLKSLLFIEAFVYTSAIDAKIKKLATIINERYEVINPANITCMGYKCRFKFKHLIDSDYRIRLLIALMKFYDYFMEFYILIQPQILNYMNSLDIVILKYNELKIAVVPSPIKTFFWIMRPDSALEYFDSTSSNLKGIQRAIGSYYYIVHVSSPQDYIKKNLMHFKSIVTFVYPRITNEGIINLVALIDRNYEVIEPANITCENYNCKFKFRYLKVSEFEIKLLEALKTYYDNIKRFYILIRAESNVNQIDSPEIVTHEFNNLKFVLVPSPVENIFWIMIPDETSRSFLLNLKFIKEFAASIKFPYTIVDMNKPQYSVGKLSKVVKVNKIETFIYKLTESDLRKNLLTLINGREIIYLEPANITCDKSILFRSKCKFKFNYCTLPEFEHNLLIALMNLYELFHVDYFLVEPIDWDEKKLKSIREGVIISNPGTSTHVFIESHKKPYIWIFNIDKPTPNIEIPFENLYEHGYFILKYIHNFWKSNLMRRLRLVDMKLNPEIFKTIVYPKISDKKEQLAFWINEKDKIIEPANITCKDYICTFKFKYLLTLEFENILLTALMKFYEEIEIYYLLVEPVSWPSYIIDILNFRPYFELSSFDFNEYIYVKSPKHPYIWIFHSKGQSSHIKLKNSGIHHYVNNRNFVLRGIYNMIKEKYLKIIRSENSDLISSHFKAFVYPRIEGRGITKLATLINEKNKIIEPANITCSYFECKFEFKYLKIFEFRNQLLLALKKYYEELEICYILIEPIDWNENARISIRKEISINIRDKKSVAYVQSPVDSYIWVLSVVGAHNYLNCEQLTIWDIQSSISDNFILRDIYIPQTNVTMTQRASLNLATA